MHIPQPPKWMVQFFEWFCRKDLSEAILGDLIEVYHRTYISKGKHIANGIFLWYVIRFFQPFAIKHFIKATSIIHFHMYQHHFKIAWRTLCQQKFYSVVKIGGFAVAISACLIVVLFVHHELSYDRHYEHADRIFRLVRIQKDNEKVVKTAFFPAPLVHIIKNGYPSIEKVGYYNASPYFGAGRNEIRRVDQKRSFHEKEVIYFDQGLLDILEIPFIEGNPSLALTQPNSVVITKRKAELYFPSETPLGKTILLNNQSDQAYRVTGVVENPLPNSHLTYDFILSLADKEFYPGELTNWQNTNYPIYLLVEPQTKVHQLEEQLASTLKTYLMPEALKSGQEEIIQGVQQLAFQLQPISDIYLNTAHVGDPLIHGDIKYIRLYVVIGLFILLIASINFINLTTAKSVNRAKEIGVKKVMGSVRRVLMGQFLVESCVFSFLSFIIGIMLAIIFIPYANLLLNRTLIFPWQEWWLIPSLFMAALSVGLIAGIYPAFYLSAFEPSKVLKGTIRSGAQNTWGRNILVSFQFTITIILILGTLTINSQMQYMLTKDLGFDKEQVLILKSTQTLGNQLPAFKNSLLQIKGVQSVSKSDYLPVAEGTYNENSFWKEGDIETKESVAGMRWMIDEDYLQTLDLNLIAGRDFLPELASDSQSVIINEAMVKALQLNQPIGQRITNEGDTWMIIGVVQDFHFEHLSREIRPLAMHLGYHGYQSNMVSIKLQSSTLQSILPSIINTWEAFSPYQSIRYGFLDDSFEEMYREIKRNGQLFSSIACLAIILASLGLFALTAYLLEQRRKEISIRKILGASFEGLWGLLTVYFLRPIFISLIFAFPIGGYIMKRWLEEYANRIDLNGEVFLISGLSIILIAIMTISIETIKTVNTHPADHLRRE